METAWVIGFMFSVGYLDLLKIEGFWKALGLMLLSALLWPLFLGAAIGGHMDGKGRTSSPLFNLPINKC